MTRAPARPHGAALQLLQAYDSLEAGLSIAWPAQIGERPVWSAVTLLAHFQILALPLAFLQSLRIAEYVLCPVHPSNMARLVCC